VLLAVGPDIEYAAVQTYNPYTGKPMTAILAESLIKSYFPDKKRQFEIGRLQRRRQKYSVSRSRKKMERKGTCRIGI